MPKFKLPPGFHYTDRHIRVFLSSTFRDMRRERHLLVTRVFPELRRICAERFVTFTEVDLRWGITEEQAAEGQVLPICLREIQRTRPYFIGLLGERYGWIPESIPADVIARVPWLGEHVGGRTSVTELEILHGVLRNPEMAEHTRFYFRDPAYLQTIREGERSDFVTEAPESAERLRRLKERIRESGLPVHEDYPSPEALADLVRGHFLDLIERLYPKGSTPDALAQERLGHQSFASRKLLAYVARPEHTARLDAFASAPSDSQALVVTGESGSGKSSLLADWVRRWREAHPRELLVAHYFGSTPESASVTRFLGRLLEELRRRFGLQDEVPSAPVGLREALPRWLARCACGERIVLVLDALNQVEGDEADRNLTWLPRHFPPNLRVVASTLPGPALDALRERRWVEHALPVFDTAECGAVIDTFFGHYRKKLGDRLRAQVAGAAWLHNPLLLRTLLEELRRCGDIEQLPSQLAAYLGATTPAELFVLLLRRWQEEFDAGDDLTRRALRHLWAARQGLSETEWLELLGRPLAGLGPQPPSEQPGRLQRQRWAPLYFAMEPHLALRSGLHTFGHDYLRQAVEAEFLPSGADRATARQALASHFTGQPASRRKAAELPWLLHELGEWHRLGTALQDPQLLELALEASPSDVVRWWDVADTRSPLKLKQAYGGLLRDPVPHRRSLPALFRLFSMTGHLEQALVTAQTFERLASEAEDERARVEAFKLLGRVHRYQGDLRAALEVTQRCAQLCRDLQHWYDVHVTLAEMAQVQVYLGRLDDALASCSEGLATCRDLNDDRLIAQAQNNLAWVLLHLKRPAEALEIQRHLGARARRLGLLWDLALSLGQQATILMNVEELEAALRLLDEQQSILRSLGEYPLLQDAIGHQAKILRMLGRLRDAVALWDALAMEYRSRGVPSIVAYAEDNQALVFKNLGDYERALRLHESAETFYRARAMRWELAKSLVNKAILLFQKLHRLEAARVAAEEAIELWRGIGSNSSLQNATRLRDAIVRDMVG